MFNTKVAILGKLETKFQAPFDDDSWDIWAFNIHQDKDKIPRVTTWFDIHANKPNPEADIKRPDFPVDWCEALVGGKYFNNSVSYLIAYAILKGYTEIALYGIRFEGGREIRNREYNNARELIFFAKGKGIKITSPVDPVMLQEYEPYGQ